MGKYEEVRWPISSKKKVVTGVPFLLIYPEVWIFENFKKSDFTKRTRTNKNLL